MYHFIKCYYNKIVKGFSGYFSQLLISLILLFVLRPYNRGVIYGAIWGVLFIIVFLSAIFNCRHSKKVKIGSILFAVPTIIIQGIHLIFPNQILWIILLIFTIIFIFITTVSIIKQVVLNAKVQLETLRGVVCAYFMIAFGFAFIYYLLDTISPGVFYASHFDPEAITSTHYISELMYFSFVTLLCIGYGDITAVQDLGQTFTVLEGIIGQFYIAILVARLVSVYSFFEHKLHLVKGNQKKK